MSLSKQEFTNAGRSMLGRAQNGETLTITRIVIGDGGADSPEDLWPLTALLSHKMNVTISAKRDFGNGTLLVEGSFKSEDAPSAFNLREAGIMAHIASEADRLYSVANAFAEPTDYIDPASPTIQAFKIKLIIDRIPTEDLIVQIGPTENITGENVGADTVGPGPFKEAVGNVMRFKRFVEGTGIEITEDAGANTITIARRQLTQNLDLFVPASYVNPPPGTLPEQMFPDIQSAHDYLLQFHIPPDKFATINLDAGLFDGRVSFSHPNGQQIYLIGRPRVDKAVTAINYVNTANRNVGVTGGVAGITVGLPVYLMLVDPGWAGGGFVTGAAGNVVTMSTIRRDSQSHYNIADTGAFGAARRLSYLPSIIYVANPNPGNPWPATHVNVSAPYGLNVMNVCVYGGYHGLSLGGDRSTINNVFCIGCGVGISCGAVVVIGWPSDAVVTDCEFGFGGGGSIIGHNSGVLICANACGAGIANGDGSGYGAIPGVTTLNNIVYLNHNVQGVRNWGQTISLGAVWYSNNDIGMEADNGGILIFGQFPNYPGANRSGSVGINGLDLKAAGLSYINYKKGAGATPTCSPPEGQSGNSNSWINVVP